MVGRVHPGVGVDVSSRSPLSLTLWSKEDGSRVQIELLEGVMADQC